MTYRLTTGWPQHIESGAFVNPSSNEDYLAWLAAGNTPEPYTPPPPPKPQVVSAFQAVAALDAAGLLASVEAMMANPATPKRTRLAWERAQEFRRNSPTVRAMGQALGLDDASLDALFAAASQIEA